MKGAEKKTGARESYAHTQEQLNLPIQALDKIFRKLHDSFKSIIFYQWLEYNTIRPLYEIR